jgi:predicted nucleic acid-binding protein
MSGNKLLLDSNILIYLSKQKLLLNQFARPGDSLHISVITLMEVKGFAFESKTEEHFIDRLCSLLVVEALNEPIVNEVIRIRRQHKIKLPDAIILATAFVNDCVLITRNTIDFKPFLESLPVIDPIANR